MESICQQLRHQYSFVFSFFSLGQKSDDDLDKYCLRLRFQGAKTSMESQVPQSENLGCLYLLTSCLNFLFLL